MVNVNFPTNAEHHGVTPPTNAEHHGVTPPTQTLTPDSGADGVPPLIAKINRGRAEARFRIPTVSNLKPIVANSGSVAGDLSLSTESILSLARVVCESWGEDEAMPPNEEMGSRNYTSVMVLFTQYMGSDIPAQYLATKNNGEIFEDEQTGEVTVTLSDGDKVTLRELTASEMISVEKTPGSGVEKNIKMIVAACTAWNGAPMKWVDVMSRLNKTKINDFYRLTQTLNDFFLSQNEN